MWLRLEKMKSFVIVTVKKYFYIVLSYDLFQVFVVGSEDAVQYAEEPVDPGSKVLPDMPLDSSEDHLFILTKNRVSWILNLCKLEENSFIQDMDSFFIV